MSNEAPQNVQIGFAVRYLSDQQVNFVVSAEGRDAPLIDLKIGPNEAAVLGRALMAASAVCRSLPPKPQSGSTITDCHFPVLKWETGVSNVNQAPIMRVTVPGGLQLTFEVAREAAKEFGAALTSEGKRNKPPKSA